MQRCVLNCIRKRILINCSNLHAGGGIAVATSFVDCLSRLDYFEVFDISLLLSKSVHNNLIQLHSSLDRFKSVVVIDFIGLGALWSGLDRYFDGQDLVFTVFGPSYFLLKNTRHLIGFAQPNIIYPNVVEGKEGFIYSRFSRLKFIIQSLFFARADALVVELEHVRNALIRSSLFENKDVFIVYSAVHTVFQNKSLWSPVSIPLQGGIKLGVISRNYPHKNLGILPEIKFLLLNKYRLQVDFYVTFQPDEWVSCSEYFRSSVINVGGLTLSQCPSFYNSMDGVIFPTLLECFSAVPIEAMMLKRPLFASDRPFIRDVCSENCNYIDPLDPDDIAGVIFSYFNKSESERLLQIESAYSHVQSFPDSNERARSYMEIIRGMLVGG